MDAIRVARGVTGRDVVVQDRGLVPRPPRHGDVLGRARRRRRSTEDRGRADVHGHPDGDARSGRSRSRSTTPTRWRRCSPSARRRDRVPDHRAGDDEHRHRPARGRLPREEPRRSAIAMARADLRRGEVRRHDRAGRRHRAVRGPARPGLLRQGDRRWGHLRRLRRAGRPHGRDRRTASPSRARTTATPSSVAAALAALTEVLTPDAYEHFDHIGARLDRWVPEGDRRARHPRARHRPRLQGLRVVPADPDAQLPRLPRDRRRAVRRVVGRGSSTAASS